MIRAALPHRGFALVDLAALILVVGALLATLLTTVARARALSGEADSADNLRTLHAAHAAYVADWNGRQFTLVDDLIASYGDSPNVAFNRYRDENGRNHPGAALGWGRRSEDDDRYGWLAYRADGNCANASLTLPITFEGSGCIVRDGLGSFRLHNVYQFNQYVSGRFYDEVFYAPKDEAVLASIDAGACFDPPDGFCRFADVDDSVGDIPAWSSYCMSPAAMFNPLVMAHDDPDDPDFNGFEDAWNFDDGFTSPAFANALYPDLKTFMLEHHWLQNNPGRDCNPGFDPGTYGGCEPYYFNHALVSSPVTLFYDGHVAEFVIADAMEDDALVRQQNENPDWGLWSKDTFWGESGYYSDFAFDFARTSVHVLTTDGIRGRDVLALGAQLRERPTALPRPRTYPRTYSQTYPRPATAPRRFEDTLPATKIVISGD